MYTELKREYVSEHWSLKAVDCLKQVVSNTGLSVHETRAFQILKQFNLGYANIF